MEIKENGVCIVLKGSICLGEHLIQLSFQLVKQKDNKLSSPRKEEQRKCNGNVVQSVQDPSQIVNQSGQ